MTKRPKRGSGRRQENLAQQRQIARQEQERQAARARRRRRLVWFAGTFAAIVLFVALELLFHRPNEEERALVTAAPSRAKGAGCGPVKVIPPFPGGRDRTHVGGSDLPEIPALSAYPSVPPVSGPHNPVPWPAGVYSNPPSIDRAIHSLEHAAVIVWYDPLIGTTSELSKIKRFFDRGDERNHVIVAPYHYPDEGSGGVLPPGTHMALAAWHHLQLCADPNLAVAYAFVARYRFDLYRFWEYRGDAPERWFAPT